MIKTNVIRLLESRNIPHTVHTYDVDESDLSGETVARKIGADKDSVFKTLVTYGDKNSIFVFIIPVSTELNLKKAAAACGSKKVEMIKSKDLLPLTGYVRGGCSPIEMKKSYPAFIDETALLFERIYVSAGTRGIQICISPGDLVSITNSTTADII